ncbi:glycosyltransferase [Carnobacterium sp. PL12RED10]|uniref:glycosyltransferase family 4 protein n=1 Tax=Carnobacterium sp. PL12RED10 TaxID=2592351 RepID=UPI0011EBFDED|nr:glycosyltransferase family 4 protein [Carnobacterium sp. PL12RED10]KAF3302248.1 glycosyltransferase [Carnobacterium sp. PL12RED10]
MKLLFSHDSILRKDSEGNFYSTTLNNDTFSRYLNIADEITIVMRSIRFKNDKESKYFSKLTLPNLKVVEVPNISNAKGQIFNKRRARRIMTSEIKDVDYVIARFPSFLGLMAYDLARNFNKLCLVELVGSPWDAYWNHSIQGKLIAPYITGATKKRVKNADYVVYVTNEFLQKEYPTQAKNIGVSDVMLTEFDDQILNYRLKKIAKTNMDKKIVIGTTAALDVKYKGQEYVIKALSKLKDEGLGNFEYQLVGGGSSKYLSEIANKYGLNSSIKFLGAYKHTDVFKWLDSIDIYIQPSKLEGLPRAVVEAMSRAVPIIGTNVGGIPELLEKEWIVSAESEIEIYEKLKKINNENLAKQALRNYEKAKNYEKNVLSDKRNKFYNEFKNDSKKG